VRFSEYLVSLPEEQQRTLTDDLTVGCGRVALAALLHRQDPRATTMLGMLATAHAALREALAELGSEAAYGADRPDNAISEVTVPQRWETLVAGANADVIDGWLSIASEMARDTAAAVIANIEVVTIREMLLALLDALTTVRNDTLGGQ